ncbi:MAG TPA: hypothetical protein VMZ29_16390 [Candidatus Bathyarchaeia archaeon]|nr:hypothetical protein [Candidatus Bathyarchaeia archaeon]
MPKFLVVHPVPIPATIEEATPIGKAFKSFNTKDAYWVNSWAIFNSEGKVTKILCQWDAKDIDLVKKITEKVELIPTEGIYPMGIFHSEDFRE